MQTGTTVSWKPKVTSDQGGEYADVCFHSLVFEFTGYFTVTPDRHYKSIL